MTQYRAEFYDGRVGEWRDSMTMAEIDLIEGEGDGHVALRAKPPDEVRA